VFVDCGLWIMDYEVMKEWSSRNNDSSDGDRMDGLMDGEGEHQSEIGLLYKTRMSNHRIMIQWFRIVFTS